MLLGANGRIGRLIAGELAGSGQIVIAGRDRTALEAMSRTLDLAVAVTDLKGLAGILHPGDVLINAVGPYDLLGDGILSCAIRSGVTYLDLAAEPAFLDRVYRVHGPEAALHGVTVVPAAGYEHVPGHMVSHEALLAVGADAASVEVAYLSEGGPDAGGPDGRRSLVRSLSQETTTFHRGRLIRENVGARRSSFSVGGGRHPTVSRGGAEVWTLSRHHPRLASVDVHTGWFGPLGPAVSLSTRFAGPFRALGGDRVVDHALRALGEGLNGAPSAGASRIVARVRGADGTVIARREAVGAPPYVVAARLVAALADRLARTDLRDLPVGATDPLALLGREGLIEVCGWAGVVMI